MEKRLLLGEGGVSGSPVAEVFFLFCGLVTGGFPFNGGVAARDSGWRPTFFEGSSFLPLAMVTERRDVPQGVEGDTSRNQGERERLLDDLPLYQGLKVAMYRGPRGTHKGVDGMSGRRVVRVEGVIRGKQTLVQRRGVMGTCLLVRSREMWRERTGRGAIKI